MSNRLLHHRVDGDISGQLWRIGLHGAHQRIWRAGILHQKRACFTSNIRHQQRDAVKARWIHEAAGVSLQRFLHCCQPRDAAPLVNNIQRPIRIQHKNDVHAHGHKLHLGFGDGHAVFPQRQPRQVRFRQRRTATIAAQDIHRDLRKIGQIGLAQAQQHIPLRGSWC